MLQLHKSSNCSRVEAFLQLFKECVGKRYVLGRNPYAESLVKSIDVAGVIDDYTNEKAYCGRPIFRTADIPKDSCVVSCAISIHLNSALQNLVQSGIQHVIDYISFQSCTDLPCKPVQFLCAARSDIEDEFEAYQAIYAKLKDKESRDVLAKILNFRLNSDVSYMRDFKLNLTGQYFEPFLNLSANDVFVDGGAFDGETSRIFADNCPSYKAIYAFEPSAVMAGQAEDNLAEMRNVKIINMGLSSRSGSLRFNPAMGSASHVAEDGCEVIQVDTLDNVVREKVTYIKLDVEGAESEAISGCRHHILDDHPRLAISVYHRPKDIRELTMQVLGIRSDYDLYLRHYTEGMTETVMYFMPSSLT